MTQLIGKPFEPIPFDYETGLRSDDAEIWFTDETQALVVSRIAIACFCIPPISYGP